jgi:transcriptional regulator with XRE-family HTH domain
VSEPSPTPHLPELNALGQSLREARQANGLSLENLATRLNMGREQLEALESGDRQRLQEPVFVIAQIRRVAGSLGLNVDALIQALRANPDFHAKVTPVAPPAAKRARSQAAPPAVTAGATGATAGATGATAGATGAAAGATGAAAGAIEVAAPAARPAPGPAFPAAARPNSGPGRPPLPALLLALTATAAVAAFVLALQRGGIRLASSPAPPALPPPAPVAAPKPLPAARPTPSAPDSLVLKTRGVSWINVITNDGRSLFEGNLKGERSFPLGKGLRVMAGRPDLVMVRVGEGPARVLGRIDQLVWHRFRPEAKAPTP